MWLDRGNDMRVHYHDPDNQWMEESLSEEEKNTSIQKA